MKKKEIIRLRADSGFRNKVEMKKYTFPEIDQ